MAIPLSFTNTKLNAPASSFPNANSYVSSSYSFPASGGNTQQTGGIPTATGGNNFGLYASVAQMAYNGVFGFITKPKTANLQASQINANAELQRDADLFKISEMRRYRDDFAASSLQSYLKELSETSSFTGTQKAQSAAAGIWGGNLFSAFLNDTANKAIEDINLRARQDMSTANSIDFKANMLELQSKLNLALGKNSAQGIKEQGKTQGILSLLGLG